MKTCFKCKQAKPLNDFYKHPAMGDGHLGKCKECAKVDVRNNRACRSAYYLAYDRRRHKENPARREKHRMYGRLYGVRNCEKRRAHTAVSNAVRDGKLKRLPCVVCGNPKSEAHHPDYNKPLDVHWLCFKHHRMEHGQKFFSDDRQLTQAAA